MKNLLTFPIDGSVRTNRALVISELKNVLEYHKARFKLIFTEDLRIKMKKVIAKLP